jgi:hypothetical protein
MLIPNPFCRLEALRACAVAVMVLSDSYISSPGYALERDMAIARLLAADQERGEL